MPLHYSLMAISRLFIITAITLSLNACDYLSSFMGQETKSNTEVKAVPLKLAVAQHIAWMPWFLAQDEKIFEKYKEKFKIDIQFTTADYPVTIEQFINGDVNAVMISNVDAIAQLVRRGIESDVILITSQSNGNDAILLPANASTDIRGKKIAVLENSVRQYLLDRYLIKQQIDFSEVPVVNASEADILSKFTNNEVYGVATSNPNIDKLKTEHKARTLFDSGDIAGEISDLLVVKRDVLIDNPQFGQALLETWFSIMSRLQGNRKGGTLEAMSRLAGLSRIDYEKQLSGVVLYDTPLKALSAIRSSRATKKVLRHIRYFVERHNLVGEEEFSAWVSFPGRTPQVLHYNARPLWDFTY